MEIKPKEIRRYIKSDGKIPFAQWIDNLKDKKVKFKINERLRRLSLGNLGDCKFVGSGVHELRID
jgi:putative addiction module killer protein